MIKHNSFLFVIFFSRLIKTCLKWKKPICFVMTLFFVHCYLRNLFFEELSHFSKVSNYHIPTSEGVTYENLIRNNLTNGIVLSGNLNNGYGNKLFGLMSALIIAILTNSKIYSIWPNIDGFIEVPFHSTTFSEFENFSPVILVENLFYDKIHIPKMTSGWVFEREISKIIGTRILTNYSKYYYAKYDFFLMEICTNPIYYDKLILNRLVKNVNF